MVTRWIIGLLLAVVSTVAAQGVIEPLTNAVPAQPEQVAELVSKLAPSRLHVAHNDGLNAFFARWDCVAVFAGLLLAVRTVAGLARAAMGFGAGAACGLAVVILAGFPAGALPVDFAAALTLLLVGAGNLHRIRSAMFYAPLEWQREVGRGWLALMGYGLVHGLALAGLLQQSFALEAAGALREFGAGAGFGAVIVVAAVFPLSYLLQRVSYRLHYALARVASVALVLAGVVWSAWRSVPFWQMLWEMASESLFKHPDFK